ncbi:ABC transporter ATP-binding protein [Microbacterium sp. M3]|uniref:ABC transporter ATP-binding protein n=1 Tax=Microbacterium arthrosphaerae TaxID=792652 RepID=A0ABU4GY01_9MICO|nr:MULTISPECIES: ABC transporter ATP-binding protein [Microbacterium]MDW4571960.1 ABC transporter ATP-binding protein [Microbacterium arthrosphaerae]MDW7605815.1 ABC transporter ATP-binding protein [Microbacterium sp. M3]
MSDTTTIRSTSRGEVTATAVGLDYNGKPALDDTDLRVHAGEFFTLLGPSGSGKTTLLRIIAGLLDPTRGRVDIDGEDVTHVPTQRRDIGFVFQNYALFPHLTVAQNIEFGLKVRRVEGAARQRRVAEMIELVALGGLGDRHPGQLSGGQQQRVALARALAQGPRVLLLDEPLGALDRALRQDLGAEVRRIQRESDTTAIYVTHDQDEAFILSDRMGVMRDGQICQIGRPEDIYRSPADLFVAKFLGQANLIDVTVVERSGDLATVAWGEARITTRPHSAVAGPEATCVIRPEQIRVCGGEAPAGYDRLGRARVISSRFLGQRQSVRFELAGTELAADLDPYDAVPRAGDVVSLCVRAGEVALIPREKTSEA